MNKRKLQNSKKLTPTLQLSRTANRGGSDTVLLGNTSYAGHSQISCQLAKAMAPESVNGGSLMKAATVKIVQPPNKPQSGQWVHYLPLVIPEKYEAHIMNMYHNTQASDHLD